MLVPNRAARWFSLAVLAACTNACSDTGVTEPPSTVGAPGSASGAGGNSGHAGSSSGGVGGALAGAGSGAGGGGAGAGGAGGANSVAGGGAGGTSGSGGVAGVGGTSAGTAGMAGGGGSGGMTTDCGITPVTPNAPPVVKRVLCYFKSIYGQRVLSGQEENNDDDGMNKIFSATGKYPAIRAFDSNNGKAPQQCVEHWNKGGLCMFGYHMRINGVNFDQATNLGALLTDGSNENKSFRENLDTYAAQIKPVQDAGGVAIVRLFHEAGKNCQWFWWTKGSAEQWRNVFKYAFDYLTKDRGLKSTIWMAPLCGSPDAAYHPGAQYIDLGGADTYVTAGDYGPLNNLFKQTEQVFPGLMVALHENGSIPDPEQLKSTGTKWLMFNTWSGEFITDGKHNPTSHLQKVYSHPYVLTRTDLPSFK